MILGSFQSEFSSLFPLCLTAAPADNFITVANTSFHSGVWSCIQASQAVVNIVALFSGTAWIVVDLPVPLSLQRIRALIFYFFGCFCKVKWVNTLKYFSITGHTVNT